MELPTIRWCETHGQFWDLTDLADYPMHADYLDCTEGARVVLPVDFDERMKAQGFRHETYGERERYVTAWRLVEDI